MPSFAEDTALTAVEGEAPGWSVALADRWGVGRNQNGGVLVATVAGALAELTGHADPFAVTGHFLGAAEAGDATVTATLIKPGRTYATAVGELWQGGRERVRVVGAFGELSARAAEGPSLLAAEPDPIPAPDGCDDLFEILVTGPAGERALTKSLRNFEIRVDPDGGWAAADRPASLRGWIRFRDEDTVTPTMLLALADAFPPTLLGYTEMGWLPTIELTVHVFGAPPADEPWIRADLHTRSVVHGLVDEDGELFDRSGHLLARFRQMAMLIPR